MNNKSLTIQLPDDLYEHIHEIAQASHRPIESLLVEGLDLLFGRLTLETDIDAALNALQNYSDAELWAVIYRRLPAEQSQHLHALNTKGKQTTLSPLEETEAEQLLELVNRYMLLRSEALLILQERGHDVERYVKTGQ